MGRWKYRLLPKGPKCRCKGTFTKWSLNCMSEAGEFSFWMVQVFGKLNFKKMIFWNFKMWVFSYCPIVVLWGWGPHGTCTSIPQPIGFKSLSMWGLKVEFWKETGCFGMRLAESRGRGHDGEPAFESRLLSRWATWNLVREGSHAPHTSQPQQQWRAGRKWLGGGWGLLGVNRMGVSLTSKQREGTAHGQIKEREFAF